MEELEVYAENTRSLLIYLNLNLFNIHDKNAYIAASHIGRGVGIVDVLKKMPSVFRYNVNFIPIEIQQKYNAYATRLWDRDGKVMEEFYDCVLE